MAVPLPWEVDEPRRVALTPADVEDLSRVAVDVADAARRAILPHFRARDLHHDDKRHDRPGDDDAIAGWDPVTAADHASEAAMRDVLATLRPEDGIVGEEQGHQPGSSGLTWVLDPIDGTRAFLAGLPTWGVLIAVFDGHEPVLGIIDQPHVDERWVGISLPDHGSCRFHHDGDVRDLHVRGGRDLHEAVLLTTYPEVGTEEERVAFERVRDEAMLTRYGADCYAYGLVAAGTVDVVVEAGLAPWDVQALIPVVRGAGGTITTWDGGPAHAGGRVIASGDSHLHATVRSLLTAAPTPGG